MKQIIKEKQINAPKEKVWNVLLEDDFNQIWMAEFNPGTRAQTDWIEGHEVRFLDADKNGIVGKVVTKQPYDTIELVYDGEVKNGQDVFDTEMAKAFKGLRESYYLSESNGVTILRVECDMGEQWYEMMASAWDKALLKIEDLAISI